MALSPSSRYIFNVVNDILKEIPRNEMDSMPFLNAVTKFSEDLVYIPPELIFDPIHFDKFSHILVTHLGKVPPTEGWRKNVYQVWMNKKE